MKVHLGRYPKDISKERKIEVRIDNYDVWGLDHTLAYIIHPALLRLKEVKQGAPQVDDADVPEYLRSTSAPAKENEWDTDDNFFERWDWVLDEMIWAFGQINEDWEDQFHSGEHDILWEPVEGKEDLVEMKTGPKDTHVFDREGYEKHFERIKNGIQLFGKYYFALWD